MFDTLKRLYDSGRLPAESLKKAVALGWITAAESARIAGGNRAAPENA